MASKAQKKMNKQKAREKESKKKVLLRREHLRAKVREEREEKRQDKRIKKLQEDMGELDIWADDVYKNVSEDSLRQLEHNAKLLKALEEESEKESAEKEVCNEDLEKKGHKTLNEKLQHLVGGPDQFEMRSGILIAPKQARDVSDVEVIKAPKKES
jgi:hypothetical protein